MYHIAYTFLVGVSVNGYDTFWAGPSIAQLAGKSGFTVALLLFLFYFAYLNMSLAIFNLIPVPPLDGSRILNLILPERYYFKIMQYERYIYLAIVLLLFTGLLSGPLSFAVKGIIGLYNWLIRLIPGIL